MNRQEILIYLEDNQDESAYGLLHDADPNLIKRFNRLCRTIRELERDVKKHFPDAQYYTASGGFHLLLGNPHDAFSGLGRHELNAVCGANVNIGDGDW